MLSGDDHNRELALAEAAALTGGRPCAEKLVEADRPIDIDRSGYISCGIERVADGATLDEVCRHVAARGIASDGFGIEVRRIPRGLPVSRRKIADKLALAIEGHPNLDEPSERFLAFATPGGVWFGRKMDSGEHDWRRLVRKPYDSSSALPSQAARAVCNLLIRGGESVLDPCCGSGSLLLHAAVLGARVTGHDINKKMVGATNKNLAHFGFEGAASVADATEVTGAYDVVLANLPYGNMSAVSPERSAQMVANIVRLAPRGVIIAASDISGQVGAAGALVTRMILLPKFSTTRWIVLYQFP